MQCIESTPNGFVFRIWITPKRCGVGAFPDWFGLVLFSFWHSIDMIWPYSNSRCDKLVILQIKYSNHSIRTVVFQTSFVMSTTICRLVLVALAKMMKYYDTKRNSISNFRIPTLAIWIVCLLNLKNRIRKINWRRNTYFTNWWLTFETRRHFMPVMGNI